MTCLSYIIPTRHSAANLERLLASINRSTRVTYEVIIVDRNSIDATKSIAETFGAKILVQDSGRSQARNAGAMLSSGECLLFLDSDMEVGPGSIDAALSTLTGCDAVILPELVTGHSLVAHLERFAARASTQIPGLEAPRLFKRNVFFEIGGYDPHLIGLEDIDLAIRCAKRGIRFGWSDVPIEHHGHARGLQSYIKKRTYYGTTDSYFRSKHPEEWRLRTSIPARLARELAAAHDFSEVSAVWARLLLSGLEYFSRALASRETSSGTAEK